MSIEEINFALDDVNFVLSEHERLYYFQVSKEQLVNIYVARYPASNNLNHHHIFDQYKSRLFQIAYSKITPDLPEEVVIPITSQDYFGKK